MSGGFLARWSRRKLAAAVQAAVESPVAIEQPTALAPGPAAAAQVVPGAADAAAEAAPGAGVEAGLPAVESLSLSSDFSAFLKEEVSEALRRKALQKLFSDPHFNRMDGLDIYIDDYSQPDPIPPEILAKLQHAREWLMADEAPVAAGVAEDAPPAGGEDGPAAATAAGEGNRHEGGQGAGSPEPASTENEPTAPGAPEGRVPAGAVSQPGSPCAAGDRTGDGAVEALPSRCSQGSGQNAP